MHAVGLVSFEHKERVPAGDGGELYVVCAYLVNHTGHAGARGQLHGLGKVVRELSARSRAPRDA